MAKKTTPNVELLDKTLAYIEEHPKEWQQGSWVCETAACFAGNALLLSGLKRMWDEAVVSPGQLDALLDDTGGCRCPDCRRRLAYKKASVETIPETGKKKIKMLGSSTHLQTDQKQAVDIKEAAQCALGLSDYEADRLFAPRNNMDGLRKIVRSIKERAAEEASA
jgi:hypothetical protein